jgi:hypothetical protein
MTSLSTLQFIYENSDCDFLNDNHPDYVYKIITTIRCYINCMTPGHVCAHKIYKDFMKIYSKNKLETEYRIKLLKENELLQE